MGSDYVLRYYMNKDKIMYYSKYCKNCDKVIQILSRSSVKDRIHFIPIKNNQGTKSKSYINQIVQQSY